MRRSMLLATVLLALCVTAAGVAVAGSVPVTRSITNGKTIQANGWVYLTVFTNPAKSKSRPVVGATYMGDVTVRFSCAGADDASPELYEAQGHANRRYSYGKRFDLTLRKVRVYKVHSGEKARFTVTVRVKGKIAKTSKKATEGSGTVLVSAPGCTTGTLKWAGAGQITTEG
jgi:hypothetical protein